MERLDASLGKHALVGLDTSVFIYHFEEDPHLGALATVIIQNLANGSFRSATSTVTLMELIVRPLQIGRTDLADRYEWILPRFPNLNVIPIDSLAARRGGELRARHQLRPADALQVGACLEHGATAFVTNDIRLRRIDELDVIVLGDFLEQGS